MSGFEAMSTEHAEELSKSRKVSEIQKRRQLSNEAKRGMEQSPLDEPATRSQIEMVTKQIKKKQKAAEEKQKVDQGEARRARALSVYQRYYSTPSLQQACGGVAPNPNWTAEQAEAHLDRVRNTMNAKNARVMCEKSICLAADGAEFVTMKVGVNPRDWDLRDFGGMVKYAIEEDPARPLEPELSEMTAELSDFLTAPWSVRLSLKFFGMMEQYSAMRAQMLADQHRHAAAAAASATTTTTQNKEKKRKAEDEEDEKQV